MDIKKISLIQNSIDYIEANLKSEIALVDLSNISGFSIYHYCRTFLCYTGMSPASFITKRRLHNAIYEIQEGSKIVDTSLLYGFDTYAGFFKAFKSEFGCSPSKYLKLNTVKRPKTVNLILEAKFMLNQKEIKKVLLNWNIDKNLEIRDTFSAGGAVKNNNCWQIGEDYLLKTGKNIVDLKKHISISRGLEKLNIPASTPIKTKTDEDFIIVEDRYYILNKKIKGTFLAPEIRYGEDRSNIAIKYGSAIGNLHKNLKKQDSNFEVEDSILSNTILNWALPATKTTMEQWGYPLPDEFYKAVEEKAKTLFPNLPKHIIHRNANPSNIMFYNGEVSGFVDFDISQRNIRIFDPCYCATGILSEADEIEEGYEKWPEILSGIIKGYDNVVGLTEDEREAIPYVIYSIQMIFIAWFLKEEQYKNIALRNREMLLWIWENRDICFKDL